MPNLDFQGYQTIGEFLNSPFGSPDQETYTKLEKKYKEAKRPVSVHAYTILDEAYFLHLKIPSESQPDKSYDVVLQFFTNDNDVKKSSSLQNYYIQFFSNSPSFIYRYAVLYKQKGYMIDSLQKKMDPKYADTLPEKTNKDLKLTFDKSLFMACYYLQNDGSTWLDKEFLKRKRKTSMREFLSNIGSFQDVKGEKVVFDVIEITSSLKNELQKDLRKIPKRMKIRKEESPKPRFGTGIQVKKKIEKIKPTRSTFKPVKAGTIKSIREPGTPARKAKVVPKKRARTTTTRKRS